jgi:hypothetical protein
MSKSRKVGCARKFSYLQIRNAQIIYNSAIIVNDRQTADVIHLNCLERIQSSFEGKDNVNKILSNAQSQ